MLCSMAKHQKATHLTISLPQDLAQAVYQQVRNGTYDSAGQLIRDAVRQLLKIDEPTPGTPPPEPTAGGRQPRTGSRQRSN